MSSQGCLLSAYSTSGPGICVSEKPEGAAGPVASLHRPLEREIDRIGRRVAAATQRRFPAGQTVPVGLAAHLDSPADRPSC